MITTSRKLITAEEIKIKLPINEKLLTERSKKLDEIRMILSGKDDRLLLIVGPCSADSETAFYTYLELLKKIENRVSKKLLIVPRLYTAKPRSKGDNYKGIIYSQDPNDCKVDFENGLITARRMFITALSGYGFVCADELLHTDTYGYFDDIAAYAVIGARNSESQQHRFLASGLEIPVAFKNPTSGSLDALSCAIYTAQRPNHFLYNGYHATTSGNPFSHAILRGGVDRLGQHFSNYDIDELSRLSAFFEKEKIQNPAIIIDVNHSNSGKNYLNQSKVLFESFAKINENPEIRKIFTGYMIESYIKDGSCSEGEIEFGRSVTDGCLGIEKTEILISQLAELL